MINIPKQPTIPSMPSNNKCKFCSKEYNLEEAEEWKDDWKLETPYIICVKDEKGYGLWSKCEDSFYTGLVMNVNYCPICGRKLI